MFYNKSSQSYIEYLNKTLENVLFCIVKMHLHFFDNKRLVDINGFNIFIVSVHFLFFYCCLLLKYITGVNIKRHNITKDYSIVFAFDIKYTSTHTHQLVWN